MMINYANEEVKYSGCPGCSYAKGEFFLPCGMAYENERFTLSQDWELPIPGFMVISPKRCIETLSELSDEERSEMFELINKTIKIPRENNVCSMFNVIFEEKENRHFHVWIMPRYDWMKEKCGGITGCIDKVFEYAKNNMRNNANYNEIKRVSDIVKEGLNDE